MYKIYIDFVVFDRMDLHILFAAFNNGIYILSKRNHVYGLIFSFLKEIPVSEK